MVPVIILSIASVPTLTALAPLAFIENPWIKLAWLTVAAPVFVLSFLLTAGLFSRLGVRSIVPGVFPRSPSHMVYGGRRIYGACWTSVYYAKAIYWLVLWLPAVKRGVFRLFGYKGPTEFVNYPDTWIRDLPLLHLGKGAYLANRATIGTNICLRDGNILVDRISIGEGSLVGHLSMVGPGCVIGNQVEIGTRCILGLKTQVADDATVGPDGALGHKVRIGKGCKLHHSVYLGNKVVVDDGLQIPPATMVLAETHLRTQEDVDALSAQQSENLKLHLEKISLKLVESLPEAS